MEKLRSQSIHLGHQHYTCNHLSDHSAHGKEIDEVRVFKAGVVSDSVTLAFQPSEAEHDDSSAISASSPPLECWLRCFQRNPLIYCIRYSFCCWCSCITSHTVLYDKLRSDE